MRVALIGSRSLPEEALSFCEWVGQRMAERGHAIVTGNAPGADQAYAAGANKVNPAAVTLFLPWASFEAAAVVPGNRVIVADISGPAAHEAAMACRRWNDKPRSTRLLLTRDVLIIGGAHAVVAWPSTGNGTRFTMGLAQTRSIPTIDISDDQARERLRVRLEGDFG